MPSDSCDHRRTTTAKPHHPGVSGIPAPPPEPEHLPCPRCDSTNTKFCYYNNYNFSQPRHFCKACRRYWTHGGTLRDIPVGGGSRKNAKRCRVNTPTTTHNSSFMSPSLEYRHMAPPPGGNFLVPFAGEHAGGPVSMCESFTSLLNSTQGPGFFGFEDGSYGVGLTIWPFSGVGDGGVSGHFPVGGGGGNGNTWQVDGGDGGSDCFALPDLAISTPGML